MTIEWNEITGPGSLPDDPGKYLCAFSDGSVETFNLDEDDIARGGWACDTCRITHWADHPKHPGEQP